MKLKCPIVIHTRLFREAKMDNRGKEEMVEALEVEGKPIRLSFRESQSQVGL